MRLIDALRVTTSSRVAFVGAGGKSSSMFRLGRQFLMAGNPRVLVSASTHLAVSQAAGADHYFVLEDSDQLAEIDFASLTGVILLTGPVMRNFRTHGLGMDTLLKIEAVASRLGIPLLMECDGSRRRPLKAPAAHEPAIPPWVNLVIVNVGASGLGQPLQQDFVHRPEIFSALSGIEPGAPVTLAGLAAVLKSEYGGLKHIPQEASRVVNINQVDSPDLAGQAKRLSEELVSTYDAVLASRMRNEGDEVAAVYRQVAGVILAAGGSQRLGRPKQLMDWEGKPFVRVCAETALLAGLSPVIVIVGAYSHKVSEALEGLPVEIVHNEDWEQGQGTSVRRAVEELSTSARPRISAAMFLLSDQPQIPVSLIKTLLEADAETDLPVVAPLIDQRRGNPVLFDQRVFPALMTLEGDTGGRQIFSKFMIRMVPWNDPRAGLDVDTEEDYRKLLDEG